MRLCALPSAHDFLGSVIICVNSTRSLAKHVKRKLRLLLTALGGTFKESENSSVFLVSVMGCGLANGVCNYIYKNYTVSSVLLFSD